MKTIKLLSFLLLIITSCDADCSGDEEKNIGCTEERALNFDYSAEENDGSCVFSKVTFYKKYQYFNNVLITNINLSVNGNDLGSLSIFYPNGPGNCSSNGTIPYQFLNGESIEWNTVISLYNGNIIYGSGTVSPNSVECLKVNITN